MNEVLGKGGDTLGMDIYDLSWYTLYLMEVHGKPSAMNNINSIDLLLKTLIEESNNFLHVLLYDKDIVVGVLLGHYILLKSRVYKEHYLRPRLFKVLKTIKSYIDEYRAHGEVLYVLKKLDTKPDKWTDIPIGVVSLIKE